MLHHQRQRRLRYRLPPSEVYHIIDEVKAAGLELSSMRGAWVVGSVTTRRRGRGERAVVPSIERGATLLLIENEERDLSPDHP